MNEITKIHLGRQAFTIAVDAHKALQEYLQAIKKQVGARNNDVTKEVELRMAELLAERGVTSEKVILLEDVDFLKEQLGKPDDFKEQADDATTPTDDDSQSGEKSEKRLFRDTERGLVAGVAAGIAAYLRIDPVIVRIGFILLTLAWGWGVVVYLVLWLIIPEAKSSSNRLQMQGRAVTVANIKEAVTRADVPGTTQRVGRTLGRFIEKLSAIILAIIGISFVLTAVAILLGTMTLGTYLLLNGGQVNGMTIFPLGSNEVWLLLCGLITVIALSVLTLFIGLAMVRRKWPVPSWVTAALVGLALVGGSVGSAVGFHVAPNIEKRLDSLRRSTTLDMTEFKSVVLKGNDTHFAFVPSDDYKVRLSYVGGKNMDDRMTTVMYGDMLTIDTTRFDKEGDCRFCIYDKSVKVTIYAPSLATVTVDGEKSMFENQTTLRQKDITLFVDKTSFAQIEYAKPGRVLVDDTRRDSREVRIFDVQPSAFEDSVSIGNDIITINRVGEFELKTDRACGQEPLVYLEHAPLKNLIISGESGLQTPGALESRFDTENGSPFNCVVISQ